MKKRFFPVMALLALLTATGCGPNREDADRQLQRACTAALKAVYGSNDTLEVKEAAFTAEQSTEDTPLRVVTINAFYTHNGGIVEEKDYMCAFEEQFGIWGYDARFYRLDRDGAKYGNFDGVVHGDLQDMIRINQAVTAMLK